MPRAEASRVLLAARDDVWSFLAEPYHLADWWPGLPAVEPDRRGLTPGARWQLRGSGRPTLFRRAYATSMLLVREVEKPAFAAWHLTAERLDVELRLSGTARDRTRADLAVTAAWLLGFPRSLPRRALERLHALCQTAADL